MIKAQGRPAQRTTTFVGERPNATRPDGHCCILGSARNRAPGAGGFLKRGASCLSVRTAVTRQRQILPRGWQEIDMRPWCEKEATIPRFHTRTLVVTHPWRVNKSSHHFPFFHTRTLVVTHPWYAKNSHHSTLCHPRVSPLGAPEKHTR